MLEWNVIPQARGARMSGSTVKVPEERLATGTGLVDPDNGFAVAG
jgi:hypothetical protein